MAIYMWREQTWPTLLTYEQIVALGSTANMVAELNQYPLDYYTELSNWHLAVESSMAWTLYWLSSNWSSTSEYYWWYVYYYPADFSEPSMRNTRVAL